MNGEMLPVVMLPRYASFVGATEFSTVPLDVAEFEKAELTLWRSAMAGSGSPTFRAHFEVSQDTIAWSAQMPLGYDPGANAKVAVPVVLTKKWFRVRIVLTGTDPGVSCWCAGHLILRVS